MIVKRTGRSAIQATEYKAFMICVICILNLFLVSTVCSSPLQELSEEEAVDMVRHHEMFDFPWTIRIYTREIHLSIEELEQSQPYYSALKSLELIELSNPTEETSEGKKPRKDRTIVSLTEKGRLLSKEWQQPNENEWLITAATREFVEFVKFHRDGETSARVEFFWTCVTNKIGDAIGQQFRKEKAIAYLQFKEGKWQIRRIHAAS